MSIVLNDFEKNINDYIIKRKVQRAKKAARNVIAAAFVKVSF